MIASADAYERAGELLGRIAACPVATQLVIATILFARIARSLPEAEQADALRHAVARLPLLEYEIGRRE